MSDKCTLLKCKHGLALHLKGTEKDKLNKNDDQINGNNQKCNCKTLSKNRKPQSLEDIYPITMKESNSEMYPDQRCNTNDNSLEIKRENADDKVF